MRADRPAAPLTRGLHGTLSAGSSRAPVDRPMTVTDLLNRLDRLRKTGEGWSALCPAHADKNPSLSVGMGDGGQILLRCFAGLPD